VQSISATRVINTSLKNIPSFFSSRHHVLPMALVSQRPADPLDDVLARLHSFADHSVSSSVSALLPGSNPDSFAPRLQPPLATFHPSSGTGSDGPLSAESIRAAIQAFFATRSRVVRVSGNTEPH
jgi:hypothetical protein